MKKITKTTVVAILLLTMFVLASCMSTGNYLPLADDETVIGTVQTTFFVQSSFFSMNSVKKNVNAQAYVRLMEMAGQKYSGNIDVRDIIWVTGDKSSDNIQTEIFATAKVIQESSARY